MSPEEKAEAVMAAIYQAYGTEATEEDVALCLAIAEQRGMNCGIVILPPKKNA